MRTTLSIDNDILAAAKAIAAQHGISVGDVVSELARRGLAPAATGAQRNGVPLFPVRSGAGTVTPEIIAQVLDEGG